MSWWRANRFWLPALPVALALMLVASAYNVGRFWYDGGPHRELGSAAPGDFVEVTAPFTDAVGETSRTFRVRLSGIEPQATFPFDDSDGPRTPPAGLAAVAVQLDWAADPDQALHGCQVALVDDEGRRYELLSDQGQSDQCVPEGQGGPDTPVVEGQERGQLPYGEKARPEQWSTAPVFLVPDDVTFTRVLVWWQLPDYVALPVS